MMRNNNDCKIARRGLFTRYRIIVLAVGLLLACLPLVAGAEDLEIESFRIDTDWQRHWQKEFDEPFISNYLYAQPTGQGAAGGKTAAKDDVFTNADEAARKSSNPLGGDFMVLLNEWNFDFLEGDITNKTRHSVAHLFQLVLPISLGGDWILVSRPTLPIIYDAELPKVPPPPSDLGKWRSTGGIGDFVWFSMLGVSKSTKKWGGGDMVLAGGFTSQFPTGNEDFSKNKYQLGPAAVAAFIGKKFIVGALPQHWNSIANNGSKKANGVNFTSIQYFYFLNFPGGWQVGAAPLIEIDWDADSDERLSLPIGLGVQKTQILFGKMPVKFGVEVNYYVVTPDTLGKEWKIKLTVAPILPNFIGNLFK